MKLSKLSMAICLCAGCSLSFAFEAGTFEASYPGIGGMVPVKVTFSKDKIEKIEVDPNKETVGIGQNAIASISSEVVKTQSLAVDNVTGATVTSKALLDGIKECVQKAKGDVAQLTKKKNIAPVIAKTETINTDLVIVGGGAAGMIAAINAADQHLKVTLVEKMNFLGGASAICGGSVVTEGSQLQKDLGVKDDTPAKLAYDLLDNGHQKNDMNALVFYVNNVGKSIAWAVAKGVKFEKDFSFRAEWRTSRMVPLKGGCPAFAETLRELVKNAKVNVLLSIKAEQVNMTDGSATGITAVGKNGTKYIINAKAVLLATGGYGYNKEMLKGSLKDALYYGPVSSTGDGHKMAENAGAAMQLMDYGKLYPQGIEVAPGIAKSTLQGNIGAYNQAGIMVDKNGNRVINEKGSGKDMVAIQTKQPASTLYLALDQKSFDGFRDYAKKNGISSEDIDKWLAQDGKKPPLFIKGNSIEEAAKKAGINPKNLLDTVEKYNSYVVNKDDKDFHRPVKFMTKTIDVSGPFYIVEQKPRFATTLGGVKVTTKMEVLDKNGKPIPNLYAAGELANSVHGDDSAPGANVAWCITTGKTVSDAIANKLQN